MRQLLQLPRGHHESHLVEALEQFVLGRVRLIANQFAIVVGIVLVVAVLFHFGHDRQLVGMLQVEQQVDGPTAAAHRYWLAANNGRERCQTLLTIQQKPRALVRIRALADREILQRHSFIRFPKQDCARWVAAIQRIQQIAHSGGAPHILALHLRQAQFAPLDHGYQFFNACFGLGHVIPSIRMRAGSARGATANNVGARWPASATSFPDECQAQADRFGTGGRWSASARHRRS